MMWIYFPWMNLDWRTKLVDHYPVRTSRRREEASWANTLSGVHGRYCWGAHQHLFMQAASRLTAWSSRSVSLCCWFSFHERNTDTSCSHRTDTGFDRRWKRGPRGLRQALHSLDRLEAAAVDKVISSGPTEFSASVNPERKYQTS